jgi:hypothetical protein
MYNVYTYNLIFYIGLSRQEWVDGIGTGSDDDLSLPTHLGLDFVAVKLLCSVFHSKKKGLVDTVYVHASYHL